MQIVLALTGKLNLEQEDRIMELMQEHSICPLLIKNTSEYHPFYSHATKTCAAQVPRDLSLAHELHHPKDFFGLLRP